MNHGRATSDVDTLIEYLQTAKNTGATRVVIGAPHERQDEIIPFTISLEVGVMPVVYLVPGRQAEF